MTLWVVIAIVGLVVVGVIGRYAWKRATTHPVFPADVVASILASYPALSEAPVIPFDELPQVNEYQLSYHPSTGARLVKRGQ